MRNPFLFIAREFSENQKLVLATVIATKGSTPQKPGSTALFSNWKLVYGTIGGGVLEGRVTKIAQDNAISGFSGLYNFDLDKDIVHKDDAICGGRATVLIDAHPEISMEVYRKAEDYMARRIPCVVISLFENVTGKNLTVDRYIFSTADDGFVPDHLSPFVNDECMKLLANPGKDACSLLTVKIPGRKEELNAFLEPLFPSSRLVIAGAGHIGKSLCHLGSRLGFEVMVVDDRGDYANSDNLPDADSIIVGDIGKAIRDLEKDEYTYIVIVTRGHNDDSEALKGCIGSRAKYIGMIGSKTKVAKMRNNFITNVWATGEQWDSIHAPVGLEINSQSVEEIAISIAAQLVLERNRLK